MQMRGMLRVGIVLALLALDWAALHDILRGEPNPYAEYAMVGASLVAFGLIGWAGRRRLRD